MHIGQRGEAIDGDEILGRITVRIVWKMECDGC
jgi:hypothetical protein